MSPLRVPFAVLSLAMLAACNTPVPDSGAGVGFTDYNTYLRQREAALRSGAPAPTPPGGFAGAAAPVAPAAPAGGFSTERIGASLDAATGVAPQPGPAPAAPLSGTTAFDPTLAGADANRPRGVTPAGIREESGEVAGIAGSGGAISDEQDFQAVSQRETIESDAERIARNRSQYVQIPPTELPQRPADTGPNIVAFALSTTHGVGQPQYRRSGIGGNPERACAKYPSADLAQQAFLERGGPERDRLGVDPDGDGFACSWDPRPFRAAQN
ncbi:MAG: hypothetical protein MUD11_17110 [Rhodobacteraceae bacterium]|jgi:hypothetical protein|nr:hypothetical protein [Paracoccaceae bacterium]